MPIPGCDNENLRVVGYGNPKLDCGAPYDDGKEERVEGLMTPYGKVIDTIISPTGMLTVSSNLFHKWSSSKNANL